MDTTQPLRDAVAEQRLAVRALSEALGRYRQADTSVQGAADELDAVGGPADRYLQASETVAAIIGVALDVSPDDGDAAGRLMAAVTVDAKVAEQAALLAMMLESPNPDGTAVLRGLTEGEIADLGEQLDQFAEPLLGEIEHGLGEDEPGEGGQPDGGGGAPWPGPVTPNPGAAEITDHSERITWPPRAETGHAGASASWEVSAPWPGPVMSNLGLMRSPVGVGRGITPFAQSFLTRWAAIPVIAIPAPGGPGPVTVEPSVREILHRGAEDMGENGGGSCAVRSCGPGVPSPRIRSGRAAGHGTRWIAQGLARPAPTRAQGLAEIDGQTRPVGRVGRAGRRLALRPSASHRP